MITQPSEVLTYPLLSQEHKDKYALLHGSAFVQDNTQNEISYMTHYYQLIDWFREKYGLWISIDFDRMERNILLKINFVSVPQCIERYSHVNYYSALNHGVTRAFELISKIDIL